MNTHIFRATMRIFVLLLILLLSPSPPPAQAFLGGPNCDIYWEAYTLTRSETSAIPAKKETDRSRVLFAFTIVPPANQYLYGTHSTDGLPTSFDVKVASFETFPMSKLTAKETASILDERSTSVPARAPEAVRKKDTTFSTISFPGSENSNPEIYPGPVTFWVEIPAEPQGLGGILVNAEVTGLLCSANSCTPALGETTFTLSAAEISRLPKAVEQPWWSALLAGESVYIAPPDELLAKSIYPKTDPTPYISPKALVQSSARNAATPGYTEIYENLEPAFFNPDLEVQYLGEALFFGILAGLLLNLMPCVLPVVSLKFSALMAVSAMSDKTVQAKAFRSHCIIFASGILVWFVVLALFVGIAGWAWGEMFQQPWVIVLLGLILFILGLSLFGVFPLPVLDFKLAGDKHPNWQAFASGLLATLLATPCSGPLLGGVLAWAIRQPLPVLILTISSVGVGMALPYCVMAFCPRLVHLLPRPGAWTLRLEQLLGFFLMGTVVYLATLLPSEWVPAFLFNLIAVAFACWLWGQIGHLGASPLRRAISKTIAIGVVLLAVWWGSFSIRIDVDWEAFNPQEFSEILGKQPLLLEFTADWCPSCKALEYTTLNKKRMAELRRRYNVRTIRVDLTRDDIAGKELLRSLRSSSIPVIALFPEGINSRQPVVLRDIVTPAQLAEAASATFDDTGFELFRQTLSTRTACILPYSSMYF